MKKLKKLNKFLKSEGVYTEFWQNFEVEFSMNDWFESKEGELISKAFPWHDEIADYWADINLKWLKHIEKKWKPKTWEYYFIPTPLNYEKYYAGIWNDDDIDKIRMERGLVFKTKEEAIALTDKILKFIEDDKA